MLIGSIDIIHPCFRQAAVRHGYLSFGVVQSFKAQMFCSVSAVFFLAKSFQNSYTLSAGFRFLTTQARTHLPGCLCLSELGFSFAHSEIVVLPD